MTFPERGIVVSVTSNISYADTYGVAVKIAQAFAEPGKAQQASDRSSFSSQRVRRIDLCRTACRQISGDDRDTRECSNA